MAYWVDKSVLVTGASGFVGSHLVEALIDQGAHVRAVDRNLHRLLTVLGDRADNVEFLEGDLTLPELARRACNSMEAVFNLAALVAGIGYNNAHPGTIFTNNVLMGLTVLDAAAREGVERFLCVSSACVYRRHCIVPTPESEGFIEDPEPTNFGYGWAKRVLEVQARAYVQEFPIKVSIVRPYNLYGPRDNFDWETSHVIPALIRKVVEGHNPIVVWGDGSQTRSFLYVSDLVNGALLALEHYPECIPMNLGCEEEITIGDLIRMIIELSGRDVQVIFDPTRPGGQPRRKGDFSKAREKLRFTTKVSLRDGLSRTIRWYVEGNIR